jgi:RND family efflux transporter MFP subunit
MNYWRSAVQHYEYSASSKKQREWLEMIMNIEKTPVAQARSAGKLLATFSAMLGFSVSTLAAGAADPPTLDCLLEPFVVVEVSSAVEGVIEKIHVDRNDVVRQGQLLVELDSEVEQTQVNLARTRAAMRTNIDLRATELAFNQRNLDRLQELYATKTISLHVKDEAETDTSKSRLQLRNAEDSQRLAQLELEKAEAILALRTMRSPIDGVVVARNKVAGEFVEDQSILRLAQLDPLKVEVIVPAEMFGSITKGMRAQVQLEYYSDPAHKATVTLVDKVIDPASGTFDVRAELPNPDQKIPSGLRCTVQFLDGPLDSSSIATVEPRVYEPEPVLVHGASKPVFEHTAAVPVPVDSTPEPVTVDSAAVPVLVKSGPEPVLAQSAPEKIQADDKPRLVPAVLMTPVEECPSSRQNIVRNYAILADPHANDTVTRKLVKQLKAQGVDDLYVVHAGENKGHVALGLYEQKPYAEERLAELAVLGFQVRMDVRAKVTAEPACISSQQFVDTGL